jgi:hypothetical protein
MENEINQIKNFILKNKRDSIEENSRNSIANLDIETKSKNLKKRLYECSLRELKRKQLKNFKEQNKNSEENAASILTFSSENNSFTPSEIISMMKRAKPSKKCILNDLNNTGKEYLNSLEYEKNIMITLDLDYTDKKFEGLQLPLYIPKDTDTIKSYSSEKCDKIVNSIYDKINTLKKNIIKDNPSLKINQKKFIKNFDPIVPFLSRELLELLRSSRMVKDQIKYYFINISKIIAEKFEKNYSGYFKIISKYLSYKIVNKKSKFSVLN